MDPIRVLIVDDHQLFREGVQAILKGVPDVIAVGEAATGAEALQQAALLDPDVILMDIQMPDMNGVQATREILKENPSLGILMVTMIEDDDFIFAAMRVGARGYILKGADKEQMMHSIRAVADGQAIFGAAIAQRLTHYFQGDPATAYRERYPKLFPELTDREFEILEHIARGKSNASIASELHISVKTVSNHSSNIFNKLQVASRAEVIILARDAGLGKRN